MYSKTISQTVLPWLRLARVSALPSAISNILLAFLLTHRCWQPNSELTLLILSSACLYIAGMILNDVFDSAVDAIERPTRPIPSGQIVRRDAMIVGFVLMIVGILFAALVGWRSLVIAGLLASTILLYDGWLKPTLIAPLLMGSCRTLNILLGASTIPVTMNFEKGLFDIPTLVWWVAISIGVYVTGITLLARKEAASSQPRIPLIIAGGLIVASLVGLGVLNSVFDNAGNAALGQPNPVVNGQRERFAWLIALIAFPMIRRLMFAITGPTPATIQSAVVTCLRSLIILDAAMCFWLAPQQPVYAVVVVALLIPSLLLARWIPPT